MTLSLGRLLVLGASALVVALLLAANLRLYAPPPAPHSDAVAAEVVPQLRFIRGALDDGAGPQMQALFPEGNYFTHVLYGLAWVNVGLQSDAASPMRRDALAEARWAYAVLDSDTLREPFSGGATLEPAYGIFYQGWMNYLLAGILLLQEPTHRDPTELAQFAARCDEIARAVEENPTPFLQAYRGSAWPVDSFPAMLSLRLHGVIGDGRYDALVARWLDTLDGYRDPATALVPHRVDPATGALLDGGRATSQTLILRFLYDLDRERALADYARFRSQYLTTVAGVPGVREFPHGTEGRGDVDSGPLLHGVSLSATVVMLGTARVVGDEGLAAPLTQAGEFLGVPLSFGGTTRYAFGLLPVGDAFLAWSKSSIPWVEPSAAAFPRVVPVGWRLLFHLLSAAIVVLPAWALWRTVVSLLRATVSPP